MGRKKPGGGYVLVEYGHSLLRKNSYPSALYDAPKFMRLVEMTSTGKVERITQVKDKTSYSGSWHFEFLPKDHLLVCRARDVIELDENRKRVRIFATPKFSPKGVQRLANGNILISTQGSRIEEYSPQGKKIGVTKLPYDLRFAGRR